MSGYVKLYRKITEWQWFNKDYMIRVWIYLLVNANHDDGYAYGVPVKRGQCLTGRKKMSKDLCLSERQIRTALTRLKSTNEIAIESTNQYSLITIINWDDYQCCAQEPTIDATSKSTNERPASDQPATTNKNDKNAKKNNNIYISKHKHGEFGHVLLTDEELKKLIDDYGDDMVKRYIRNLDEGIEMKGYKYKSHYLAMRNWIKRDRPEQNRDEEIPVYDSSVNPEMDNKRLEEILRRRG